MNNPIKLNSIFTCLSKNKKPKLLGRGIGCGKGKTSGRGHKGQKARTGVSINGFEGGQQSIYTRLPKRGFKSIFRNIYRIVNVDDIQCLVDSGKIKKGSIIDKELLYELNFIKSVKDKIKLLNNGKIKDKLVFRVDYSSEAAKKSVEKVGGNVEIIKNPEVIKVNVGDIQRLVDSGKIKKGSIIDKELLHELNFIKSVEDKIKLVNKGKLNDKLVFHVDYSSEAVKKSVEKVGGNIETIKKHE